MLNVVRNRIAAFERFVWEQDLNTLPRWQSFPLKAVRIAYALVRDFMEGRLTLQAMSLVYTTLLSLVPLIAVSFSVLKAFGVHNQVEPLLLKFLEPLGERGVEITNRIIGFVDNIKVGVLGSLGIAMLIYTAVSLIQKMEDAYNYTWHVGRSRSFASRFSNFLSIIIMGPVLIFTSLGITATVTSTTFMQTLMAVEPFGSLYRLISLTVPYMLAILAFTLTYLFIPNTSVRVSSALAGGVAAGVLWNITGKLFATFVLTSTQYTAIYSGFAIALLFMIWLYLSWFITLIGASIGFYVQHPEYLIGNRREFKLSNRMKERLSLALMVLIARRYYRDQPAYAAQELAKTLTVPSAVVDELLDVFVEHGLLSRTDADPSAYLPVRPLEHTTVKQVLDVVRHAKENPGMERHARVTTLDIEGIVTGLETAIDTALQEAVGGYTLKDLALSEPPIEQTRNESLAYAGSAAEPAPQRDALSSDAVRDNGA